MAKLNKMELEAIANSIATEVNGVIIKKNEITKAEHKEQYEKTDPIGMKLMELKELVGEVEYKNMLQYGYREGTMKNVQLLHTVSINKIIQDLIIAQITSTDLTVIVNELKDVYLMED
jgi:hypothetical protein